ncbi:MAG: serine/threonine-protein kinase [Candidatus Korobacteraceae bacterium]
MSDQINRRMGDYEVISELGAGGMGRVYKVRNILSDRVEAMKVLLPDLAGRQELAARFLREIKVLASLNHPNIAQLRTAFTADNQLIMIMEYVEGTSLAARIERGPIAPAEALNYIDQALNALSYAHQQLVIHRDIKPANMMLTPQGVVKLMDFGIARTSEDRGLTSTGSTLGSLSYMSPEQTTGQGTDTRSDLYSVGVSLYEMVTGQRPFQGDSDFSIMTAQVKENPRPPIELQPGLPAAMNEIILMAMAKDPAQRFQTAEAFRNALHNVGGASPIPQPGTRGGTMLDTPIPATLHSAATASLPRAAAAPAATMFDAQVTPRPSGPHATMIDAHVTPRPSTSTGTVLDARVTPRPGSSTGTVLDARPVTATPLPPARPSGHRGLYMALGAVVMLAALVFAGLYLPKHSKADNSTTTDNKQVTPTPTPVTPNPPPNQKPAPGSTNPDADAAMRAKLAQQQQAKLAAQEAAQKAAMQTELAQKKLVARAGKGPLSGAPPQGADVPPNQPPAPNAAEMDQLEHEIDQLTARAAAVNNSLDTMQAQQRASGYGMRGDIVMKQASMKTNLAKAQDAFQHGDASRAQRYADLTQSDLATLEHFLGR